MWAGTIVAVPFALTGAILLEVHLFGHHETVTVNWAWCTATGLALAAAWLLKKRRKSQQAP